MRKLKRDNRPPQLRSGSSGLKQVAIMDAQRDKAFDMLINEHLSIPTIADRLGINRQTAYKWINHIHERTLAGISEKSALIRDRQNIQYDQIIERWMPLALHENLIVRGEKYNRKGERETIELDSWDSGTKAAEIVLKAMAQKARTNGLTTVIANKSGSPDEAMKQFMDTVMPSLRKMISGGSSTRQLAVIPAEIVEG